MFSQDQTMTYANADVFENGNQVIYEDENVIVGRSYRKEDGSVSVEGGPKDSFISQGLSDHEPFILRGEYNFLSLNMMAQGTQASWGYNNALGIVETDTQVRYRYEKLAKKLGMFINEDDSIIAIALQEAPVGTELETYFLGLLAREVPNFDQVFTKAMGNVSDGDGLITLIHHSIPTQKIADTKLPYEDRTDSFSLTIDDVPITLINAYLPWKPFNDRPQVVDDIKILMEGKRTNGVSTVTMIGDFNLDPLGTIMRKTGLSCESTPHSSLALVGDWPVPEGFFDRNPKVVAFKCVDGSFSL